MTELNGRGDGRPEVPRGVYWYTQAPTISYVAVVEAIADLLASARDGVCVHFVWVCPEQDDRSSEVTVGSTTYAFIPARLDDNIDGIVVKVLRGSAG